MRNFLMKCFIAAVTVLSAWGEKPHFKAPVFNYKCINAEIKCIRRQSFIIEAVTTYQLAYMSLHEVKLACTNLHEGEECIKEAGCRKDLAAKVRLMRWICRNKRELFRGTKCWRSSGFRTNAPKCDEKIQKSCHYHKLVGTCLKTVIAKNKSCTSNEMHFYGGLLEAIDRMKNPNGRCTYGKTFH